MHADAGNCKDTRGPFWDVSHAVLAMQKTEIFIVGDLILDTYVHGNVERISPEAPVPIVHVRSERHVLGGAGNVAANIRSMGARAILCGRLGRDRAGEIFAEKASEAGLELSALVWSQHVPSTRKTRILGGSQQLLRLDEESREALSDSERQSIILHFERFCSAPGKHERGRALVLSDYDKGVLSFELIRELIQIARKHNIAVIADPKKTDVSVYAGATVLKPNRSEASAMLGVSVPRGYDVDLAPMLVRLLQLTGVENIVLSRSEDGVVCGGSALSGQFAQFPSTVVRIADVSGAGDTMVAFLAMGMAAQLGLARATELGNVAAGIVCGIPGTAVLKSYDFVRGYQHSQGSRLGEKLVDLDVASAFCERLRAEGCKIVFTNGCFDLVHPGHIHTLRGARALGDFLVVGLNSDSSIKRLKGESRPVQDQDSRAAVLAGLAFVDFIVVFEQDTPEALIRSLKPDVLVKGGDYKISEIVGSELVLGWGGQVTTVPLVPNQSTTAMIARSKKDRPNNENRST